MFYLLPAGLFLAYLFYTRVISRDQVASAVQSATATILNAAPTEQPQPDVGNETRQIMIDAHTGEITGSGLAAGVGASAAGIAGSSGTLLGLSATAWTGIGAAIAGIIVLVYTLRSTTHLYANELVQKYENPFGQYVIAIITHETNAWTAHTLLQSDAQAFYDAVRISWEHYQEQMQRLMTQGKDWLIVAKQSLNNLDNQYQGETLPNGRRLSQGMGGQYPNGFMSTWLAWMHDRIAEANIS